MGVQVQGEVLYFDAERGVGFISGTDGNRYHFDRADLSGRSDTHKGERVEFLTAGNRAQNVASLDARPASSPDAADASLPGARNVPTISQSAALPATAASRSLFGYFRSCITGRYANFRGRARRKEYWGFLLFAMLMAVVMALLGATVDGMIGNLDREEPVFTTILALLAVVAILVPSLAVTVRRIHDIGLSGWFVLLGLIPSVGNLIILVFALIPSQKHTNKWGDVPAGAL